MRRRPMRDPKAPPQAQELEAAAKILEVTIKTADVDSPQEIDGAMQALASQRVDAVIVLQTTLLLSLGRRIAELALAKRLPTIYGYREHVLAGGLVSYGVDLSWCYRRSAHFVDKILQGTPPGRSAGGVSEQDGPVGQSQDRQGACAEDFGSILAARRRGDRVKRPFRCWP